MMMCLSNGNERDASEKFSIFVVESHPRECKRKEMREKDRGSGKGMWIRAKSSEDSMQSDRIVVNLLNCGIIRKDQNKIFISDANAKVCWARADQSCLLPRLACAHLFFCKRLIMDQIKSLHSLCFTWKDFRFWALPFRWAPYATDTKDKGKVWNDEGKMWKKSLRA